MELKFLTALVLTVMPLTELRIGLPVAINYAIEQSIPIFPIFLLIILLNVLLIFFVFYFLDNLHHIFMNFKIYKKFFESYIRRFQRKVDKFERKHGTEGFVGLALFVGVPLPGTGAWSGCLVSWLLGLERKKSILAIACGVTIAGILILFGTLGFINWFI